jgi:dCMP deaminase
MRISRHQMFMEIAHVVSKRSTCFRRSIGAVIIYNNNIVSIGYNGPASGEPHCTGAGCVPDGQLGCQRALHAEANAIKRAPMSDPKLWNVSNLYNCVMYTTESPCPVCVERIIDSKISKLYYTHLYRVHNAVDLLAKHILVFRITPSGYIVDHVTGEIVDEEERQGVARTSPAA